MRNLPIYFIVTEHDIKKAFHPSGLKAILEGRYPGISLIAKNVSFDNSLNEFEHELQLSAHSLEVELTETKISTACDTRQPIYDAQANHQNSVNTPYIECLLNAAEAYGF